MAESSSPAAKSLFPILLVNFIGTLGYSLVLPFLVVIVLQFGGNELIYGVAGATYSFFQLIGAPVLGTWSDRIGRRKVLLISQAGTFVAWIILLLALLLPRTELFSLEEDSWVGAMAVTVPLVLLFLARALDGLTGGNVSVANAYMADISDDSNRNRNFGRMAAAGNMGFIFGPTLAGVLGATAFGATLPVIAAMVISAAAIAVIALQLKDYDPCEDHQPVERNKARKVMEQEHKECHKLGTGEKHGFRDVMRLPGIPYILTLYFLIFLAFNFFYVSFPVHAIQGLGWSVFQLGIFFSILGCVLVVVEGPILSRLSKRFSSSWLVVGGSIPLTIGFSLFCLGDEYLAYAGAILFSIGNGIMWPSFMSVLASSASDGYQGAVQGYAGSTGSLASIAGLLIGGVIYGIMGIDTFWIPTAIMALIAVLSINLARRSKTS